jgi:nucleoside-diphosphate kinase
MEEETLIIIKPDGLKRHLVGKILEYFEDANLNIEKCYISNISDEKLREHYSHLVDKPFFPQLKEYMQSGPCFFGIVSGENAIARVRAIEGNTDPLIAERGTIRSDFGTSINQNLVHGSDSKESAKVEIKRFFS